MQVLPIEDRHLPTNRHRHRHRFLAPQCFAEFRRAQHTLRNLDLKLRRRTQPLPNAKAEHLPRVVLSGSSPPMFLSLSPCSTQVWLSIAVRDLPEQAH